MKKKIYLFAIFATFVLVPCSSAGVNSKNNVDLGKITTYKEISARDAVENSKIGWNLGNTFDCRGNIVNPSQSWIDGSKISNYETAWGNPLTTQELIHYVKSLGFQGIRIPVSWGEKLEKDNTIKSAWMDRVKEVVEWALNEDFYVILNVHHDTGVSGWLRATNESYTKYKTRYEKIWQQIAAEFGDYSEKLMFESFNEMLNGPIGNGIDQNGSWGGDDVSYEYINKWNQLFVNTVRATGENNATRNLICNTYASSLSQRVTDYYVLPTDTTKNHLICQVHCYNVKVETLNDDFLRTALFAERIGCPIIIGEWGSSTDNSGGESFSYLAGGDKARAAHAKAYISQATKRGFACYVWDDGGAYQQIDRTNLSLVHPSIVDAIIKSVQKTTPLTAKEKKVTSIKNFTSMKYTVDDNLKFNWVEKPVIAGDTNGKLTFLVSKTDWSKTFLWFEVPYSKMQNSYDFLDIIIKADTGVSKKSDLPDKLYFQLQYNYGDKKSFFIIEADEISVKK